MYICQSFLQVCLHIAARGDFTQIVMNQIYMADMGVRTSQRSTGVLTERSLSLSAEEQQAVIGIKKRAQEVWKDAVDRESGNVTGE